MKTSRSKAFSRYLPYICALLFCTVFLSSCLRYVPSRSEIKESKDTEKTAGAGILGPEEFYAYERKLDDRLDQLVRRRNHTATSGPARTGDYRLQAGDNLTLEVFGFSDLSTNDKVATDGTFTVPLVGPVQAGGLTVSQFRTNLTGELRQYVREPRVKLSVKEFGGHPVSVVGEVHKPGVYFLERSGQTLTELLSLAGGRTERASNRVILIPSKLKTKSIPSTAPAASTASETAAADSNFGVEFDVAELFGTTEKLPLTLPLVAGDTVVIPEMGSFQVAGEVNKTGSFPLRGKTSALGSIAAAGGFTYSANVQEVEVIREVGSGKKASVVVDLEQVALNGSPDVVLRDGDIIRVPSEPGKFKTRQVVEVINGFFRGGVSGSVRYN